ncbi:MAG: hypothetical protein RLZZ303_501 [Candidatus Hydrogenedentota bacterium]|jgi:protoporphyrinogen oxidase
MRIGIIGAGISGMSAALRLANQGHEVHVFQREGEPGGLLATFDFDGVRIEHFYHFLCAGDAGYFALCEELGLGDRIRFEPVRTGFYYDGVCYPFTEPLDLLRFAPIPFFERLKFGLFALEARLRKEWRQLDAIAAKPWLIQRLGQRTYDVVWEPLLSLKFGEHHERVSAAWIWHRIHRVAKSGGRMGYLDGGTGLLLDSLAARLKQAGVTLHTYSPVRRIRVADRRVTGLDAEEYGYFECDRVVSTIPLDLLAGLLPDATPSYDRALRAIQYIGVVCVTFKLRQPVSPYFWLNVHDPRVPMNGIIEYTNLNPIAGPGVHIAYVPYYVPTDHPSYRMRDDDIIRQSWQALKVIAPQLSDDDLLASHVARAAYAQAICEEGFLNMLPAQESPIAGLWLLDSVFLYPEDRTQSGQIRKAWEVADHIHGAGH